MEFAFRKFLQVYFVLYQGMIFTHKLSCGLRFCLKKRKKRVRRTSKAICMGCKYWIESQKCSLLGKLFE